jgi:hypothetical protein
MCSTASNTGQAPQRLISFDPVLRRDNIPQWRLMPEATDYRVIAAATISFRHDSNLSFEQRAHIWCRLGHIRGIRVLHKWNIVPTQLSELAAYHGMREMALVNFTDTVGEYIPNGFRCLPSR